MKAVHVDNMMESMSAHEIQDMLDLCHHNNTNNDKKLTMLHAYTAERRTIPKGMGHLELANGLKEPDFIPAKSSTPKPPIVSEASTSGS